jgi:hypothetical protein
VIADAILFLHIGLVVFVVGALPAVWVGAHFGGAWVRNRVFRGMHLGAILFIAAESLLGIACPLTVWEYALRGDSSELGLIQRWVRALLYWDWPSWVFAVLYCAFALLVIWTWLRIPPRVREGN